MAGRQYNVIFDKAASDSEYQKAKDQLEAAGGVIKTEFGSYGDLKGFSATIPDQYLTSLQSLQGGIIETIEPDSVVSIQ
ncbi:hypothetical protein BV22DRAFT_1130429 [Leucogyrophana mollusca]|uniref:Uncharacterized protein n=1 Tax=Leucogyrophana mollusca TaxID=85980 RepID=A0ACB8BEP3_9AGAM|nr:hypothetical protein BV22DRAFT_1130429 [Leucogyrophana mollusca]